MSLLTFLSAQKTHILYILVIIGGASAGFWLFKTHPSEIIKTVTQTQFVNRDVVKVQTKYIDRVIVQKQANGTVTTTTEKEVDNADTTNKTKSGSTTTSKTDTKFQSKYTLGTYYTVPLPSLNQLPNTYDLNNQTLMGGIRIFGSPVFLNLGTNAKFNQVIVGLTLEL